MRRALAFLAVAVVLAVPSISRAGIIPLEEQWGDYGVVIEMDELDGQHGLDILLTQTSSGRLELRRAIDGVLEYQFPNGWGDYGYRSLIDNLDSDPENEFVMCSAPPGDITQTRIGLFEVLGGAATGAGAPAPPPTGFELRWSIQNYGPIDQLHAGDFEGAGRKDIVATASINFRVHDSLDGTVKFDWQIDGPTDRRFEALEVVDLDQDGRDEILVQSTDLFDGPRMVHVVASLAPLTVGDGPAFEARALGVRNAPTPFSGPTEIGFTLPARARVTVQVYDAAGRRVRDLLDEARAPGRQTVTWDGRDDGGRAVRSGVYFYEVEAGGERVARKMLRVR